MVSRRRLLKLSSAAVFGLAGCSSPTRDSEPADESPEPDPVDREPSPTVSHPAYSDTDPEGPIDTSTDQFTQNVQFFGAEGDGTTDDTEAIQAAIDAAEEGDTVVIPETDDAYRISPDSSRFSRAILQIQGDKHPDNLTITGEGSGSVLKVDDQLSSIHTHQIFAVDIQSGLSGLEIRNLALAGTSDSETEYAIHGIRCGNANEEARNNIDILVEDVLCEGVSGIGFKSNFGGVRFNRCTAIDSYWHGFETTANEVQNGSAHIEDPPVEVTNSYALRCGVGGGGHYGHNSSGGKSITRNFVARKCFSATKVTSPTTAATYQNVRFEDSIGAGFQRTGSSGFPEVTWGNAVIENNGVRAITGRLASHTFLEGAEILAIGNAEETRWDVHFYQRATLDADDATLYVNKSNAEFALQWGSENTGELGTYVAAQNVDEDLYKNGNLTIHEQRSGLKTDVEAVPTANEVGAWS
ncbi:glycosyl hydrolase family 28-related protein [Halovenus marina]|uniref:glycosyl hydrolase family 28-related protein n=1 Tax=Halovenus marina TaxID=3396621 RepID=UPI003F55EA25